MQSIEPLLKKTKSASHALQQANAKQILTALKAIASTLESDQKALLHANRKDVEKQDPKSPRVDRLLLNEQRIMQMANAIRTIGRLPDPSGKLLEERTLSNGLLLQKQTAPLGVVGAIYESRPNVTFDIAALCLRSRNACLLKGSSEAENTNKAALHIIHRALRSADLPPATVTLLPVAREVLTEMFTATRYLDVIIPRGSEGLIQYVRKNSLVPVIETGAGVCHVYVEARANLDKALAIAVNAKVSRPSVCNAMDTLLVDKAIAPHFLQRLAPEFGKHKVEIFAAPDAYRLLKGYPYLHKAVAQDFGREYLSLRCSLKIVDNIDEALQHIEQFSTRHSEAIVSESRKQCDRFVREVDAAVVYTNASTRFTDGEEFGLGAEIGISTQKLHARGPFALEKLVTEKWVVRGSGQVR